MENMTRTTPNHRRQVVACNATPLILLLISFPAILSLVGCFTKSESAIRANVEQEIAIKHSIEQKTVYVEGLLAYIETKAMAEEQTDYDAAIQSLPSVQKDGTINLNTANALNRKRVERIRAIQGILADARSKWALTLVDDANALAFNSALSGWLKTKIEANKVLSGNADAMLALLERILAPKPVIGKVVTP